MGLIYGSPRRFDRSADPGKVSTGIQVGMRPETTLAIEKMF